MPSPDISAPATLQTGTFAPFGYPTYRAIWIANLASNLGSMIQSVAAAWLMTDLTHSHRLVAMVQSSTTLPIPLFGVLAGAIADNYDRRQVMLWAQGWMLVVSTALAVMAWQGTMTPALLLAFTLAVGAGLALNQPAWQASVRSQVDREILPQAITLNAMAFNLARCAGPALGGLLISVANVGWAFAVNAVSYVGLIVVLLRWRPDVQSRKPQPIVPAMAAGLRFCATDNAIRRVLLRGAGLGLGTAGFHALVPMVVRGPLHGSEVSLGILLGLFGVGSVLAAVAVGEIRRRMGVEGAITAATLAFVVAQMVLASASTLIIAGPAALIAGAGWVSAATTLNVSMQMRSPEGILGRCMSIYQAVTFGAMALGAWIWGTVADWLGLAAALHGAALWLISSLVVLRIMAPLPAPPGPRHVV